MNMEADDLLVDRPVVATLLVAAVATLAYGGLQLVIDGAIAPVETAIFVVVFTFVYVSGNWYLRKRDRDDGDADATGGASDDPEAGPGPSE